MKTTYCIVPRQDEQRRERKFIVAGSFEPEPVTDREDMDDFDDE